MDDQVLLAARCDVLDRLREATLLGLRIDDQPPNAIQEVPYSIDSLHAPRLGRLQRPHEHFIEPQRIGSILFDDSLRIDHILQRLGHLGNNPLKGLSGLNMLGHSLGILLDQIDRDQCTALVFKCVRKDHPLIDEFLKRFGLRNISSIVQDLMPKPRIQQMKDRMFGSTDVKIDRHPGGLLLPIDKSTGTSRTDESQVIPTRSCPLGHRVGLASISLAIELNIEPRRIGLTQRGFWPTMGLVILQIR